MARSSPSFRAAAVLLAALASGPAISGNPDSGKKPTNSFNLVYAAAPQGPAVAPAMGVGVPGKPVVTNPYNVPLLQNAGSLSGAH